MRRLPSLNALRAFEEAARHSSFKKAASELSVTHGAVSRHVALLEAWLGVQLFRRLNRQVMLTEQGRALYQELEKAFDRIEMATADVAGRYQASNLSVKAPPTLLMRWLIPRLARFQSQNPAVKIKLSASLDLMNTLNEDCDLVIRRIPHAPAGMLSKDLLSAPKLLAMAPALAARYSGPASLAKMTLIHVETSPDAWYRWFTLAGEGDLGASRSMRFEQLYYCIQAAIDGLGAILVPAALVVDEVESGRLVFPKPAPRLEGEGYKIFYAPGRDSSRSVARFMSWILEEGKISQADVDIYSTQDL